MTEMNWHPICALTDIPDGGRVGKFAKGQHVLLIRLGADVFAYEDRCPHAGAPMSDGRVSQGLITCRHHHWQFDIRTGAALRKPGQKLKPYSVKIEADKVLISFS